MGTTGGSFRQSIHSIWHSRGCFSASYSYKMNNNTEIYQLCVIYMHLHAYQPQQPQVEGVDSKFLCILMY